MKRKSLTRKLSMLLVVVMLACSFSMSGFAASVDYSDSYGGSDYYQVISKKDWELAPGVAETEIVLNNDAGTRRQVVHTVTVDIHNPYTKVISGYKGMWPEEGNYGTEATSKQALNAEKLGYGNVVAATNTTLSFYTSAYYKENPHLIGEPLGYTILDGKYYANSRGNTAETSTCIVINYDNHPISGEERSEDIPKVWIRSTADPLTGWEEQVIPVSFGFLVKPDPTTGKPVNQYKTDHGTGIASRTFVGVKADGTLVISVSDGEQAPYSTGFTNYEMADYMIKMGCIIAANCDGGGSTTFCTQRPGEDLKVNCSLSDGGERPTTSTILVISEAPADGVFARATIDCAYDYYTPGSTVEFSALGTDAVGTKVDIPEDVEWTIKEENMGTIKNGVFTSNGTEGDVTVQMVYDGKVVGEREITMVIPEEISFDQPVVTVPFGQTAIIPVKATIGNGVYEIGLGENDVTFTTDNEALGQFSGLKFIAVDEKNAPENITSTVTATLNMGTNPSATVQLNLGKGSEVLWGFENGQSDIDEWNVINNRKNAEHWDYYMNLSLADRSTGQVHDGNYSMRLETNGLSSKASHSDQYAWIRLGVDGDALVLENARSVGFWLYVPEDNIQCWVQGHYMTDSDGNGTYDTENVVSMMESENVYYNIDESGWHYLSMDISAFKSIALKAAKQYDKDPSDGMTGETGEFFLALVFHKAINNKLWQENGSINGPYTYYLDNFTVDYSEAVDDRENPVFDKIYLDNTTPLVKRDVVTTTSNILNLSASVADASTKLDANKNEVPLYNATGLDAASARVYVDGVEVASSYVNGKMTANNVAVADGYHRVKFEICDKAGNKSVIIRVVKVESGVEASTLKLVPADTTLDRIPFGSIYWMNLEANAIETIQEVATVIDLNNVNHWQLDHMELAAGFTAEYTIAEETNTAAIKFTRTGNNDDTGAAVLAKIPVRMLYFDTDIKTPGYTAETYWTSYSFWPQDLKMDVDLGEITYVDGYKSDVLPIFSNEEFHVDTEMYTSMPNMDKAYLDAHGTTHVHTPVAIEDKEATCTEAGYEGRTFCEGCNSPVEWGTTIQVTEHAYKVDLNNRKLVCDCEKECTDTGLHIIDEKSYYTVNGKLTNGWITIEDEWYYFDKNTYEGIDGEQYADRGIKFNFDNGRVITGTWVEDSKGVRYWYGPGYYNDTSPDPTSSRPYEIDGKVYLFNRSGYMQTGIVYFFVGGSKEYYDCGSDGVATIFSGPYEDRFYINGVVQTGYKLIEHNGDYYFISDYNKIAKNTKLYLNELFVSGHNYPNGDPILPGSYEFGADGKMILLNGPVGDYFYVNGIIQKAYKLVEFDGDYYFINDHNKLLKNTGVYLSSLFVEGHTYPNGDPMLPGRYEFDADGKMIILNGPVDDYFYVNGIIQKAYKLVEYEGDYYFINDYNKLLKNTGVYLSSLFVEGHTYPNGDPMLPGRYEFDEDGKMIILNGPVDDYFYVNGIIQKAYKLVEYEGDYYFINDYNKLLKNTGVYLSSLFVEGHTYPNGDPMLPGRYEFNEDGKMIILNGPVDDYFYINGIIQKAYKLVEYEGDYYFINDYNKLLKNTGVYLSSLFVDGYIYPNGDPMLPGRYEFDADGKMIILNGPVGDYFYVNGIIQNAYKLVEYDGDFYFINDHNKLLKNKRIYLSPLFVEGYTYPNGDPMQPGSYEFDVNGKMILN